MALEQRLKTEAERTGLSLARLRKRVAFEDLIDILLIADSQTLEAAALREALSDTFEARAHQVLPGGLPAPPPEWALAYGRLAEEVGSPNFERAQSARRKGTSTPWRA